LGKLALLAASAVSVLLVAGCAGMGPAPTAVQREVASSNSVAQAAVAQAKACRLAVNTEPEFARLLPYLPDPVTGQFSMVQLTNETRPTAQDAALFASWYDANSGCNRVYPTAIQSARPDVAAIEDNWLTARSQVATQLVERRITWAEFARQWQRLLSEANTQIAEANQQWGAEANAENQAELNRRNAVLMQYMANQTAITESMPWMHPAQQPVQRTTICRPMGMPQGWMTCN